MNTMNLNSTYPVLDQLRYGLGTVGIIHADYLAYW